MALLGYLGGKVCHDFEYFPFMNSPNHKENTTALGVAGGMA
jgi:hypothetical protein